MIKVSVEVKQIVFCCSDFEASQPFQAFPLGGKGGSSILLQGVNFEVRGCPSSTVLSAVVSFSEGGFPLSRSKPLPLLTPSKHYRQEHILVLH